MPAAERFARWRECQNRTHAPRDMSSDHAADFHAQQRTLRLGAVTVWPAVFQPSVLHRTARLIGERDPEAYHLALLLRGTVSVRWGDRETVFQPYDIVNNDTSRPSVTRAGGRGDTVRMVGVELPKALLPFPRDKADQVIGRVLSGRDGVGALLAAFLTQVTFSTHSYLASDGPRLGTVLTDLVTSLFANALDEQPEAHRRPLTARIRAFIGQHLHDPALTPGAIAAAHHISTSYLHRIFQADVGVTVAAWIRRQRLERARCDLADPAMRAVPIRQIAVRCGFPDHAAFTRAFRSAYGVPPRDCRVDATPTNCELNANDSPAAPRQP